jgi:hypothetical protein
MSEQSKFTCLSCGKPIPESEQAEALAELERRIPGARPEDCIILCDDCAVGIRGLLHGECA